MSSSEIFATTYRRVRSGLLPEEPQPLEERLLPEGGCYPLARVTR